MTYTTPPNTALYASRTDAEQAYLPQGIAGFAHERRPGQWMWVIPHDGGMWSANTDGTMTLMPEW